jgi:hypothetical protein
MTQPAAPDLPGDNAAPTSVREVGFEYSLNLAPLLEHLGVTLLVSTYQAGKLVIVSTQAGKPEFAFHSFERAMGLAARSDRIAVGTRAQIWLLRAAPDIASRLASRGHDACAGHAAARWSADAR